MKRFAAHSPTAAIASERRDSFAVSSYTAIKKARQAEKSEREDGPCVMLI